MHLNDPSQPVLTWDDLHQADLNFNTPFTLQLTGGQSFAGIKVVRMVTNRRMVVLGMWQGRPAVAKLFFDPHRAKRHMEKDLVGIKILQKNKIPTPGLYYEGTCLNKKIYVLIFERVLNSQGLDEIWQNKPSIKSILPTLKSIAIELATQHVLGVKQNDLHFKNFLLRDQTIYTLDGGGVCQLVGPLNAKESIENVALFLSQLGVSVEHYQDELFKHYAEARSWLLKKEDITGLFHAISTWNKLRWRRFSKKIVRDSSNFAYFKHKNKSGMVDRQYASKEILALLENPDRAFFHETAQLLKVGGSSTVVKVEINGQALVIKRYNTKSIRHFLRRLFRKTRAFNAWRLAQKLSMFGTKTAAPIAFIEERYVGLPIRSYYITEYVSNINADDYFTNHFRQEDKIAIMVDRIARLLNSLTKLAISHGDLKITNILIDENEQPVLIDLDGAKEHSSVFSLARARKKEIARFLKNFLEKPSIQQQFKQAFLK
jgi:tRNA A-37 threonylcarbamoyl transferase component Bud32